MPRKTGLLADIQAGAVDESASLESLLQKCIALGGEAGSVKLRDWARQELNGYSGNAEIPGYRTIGAQLMATITNRAGRNGFSQEVYEHMFPKQIRESLPPLNELTFYQGVGELEAMVDANDKDTIFSPSWAPLMIDQMNRRHMDYNSVVTQVYWPFSAVSVRGALSRIRTALVELATELADLTPQDQAVPAREATDQVVQFIITGDRAAITYSPQTARDHGTITSASGDNATAVGNQSVTGDNNTTAGRDTTAPAEKGSWWARWRKRGLFVGLATILAAVIAVLTYLGLAPSPAPTSPPATTTSGAPTTAAPIATTSP